MTSLLDDIRSRLTSVERLVCLDMETTGNRTPTAEFLAKQPKGMRPPGLIIEIGCIEIRRDGDGWTKGETWISRVRPDAPISPGSIKVHGIRPADLTKAPRFSDVADGLVTFLGDDLLVAHAALNEQSYLNYEYFRCGRCRLDAPMFLDERFLCTQKISHAVYPGQSGSLDALCDRMWIDRSDRFAGHGALLDADLTADAFIKFVTGDFPKASMEV